MTPPKTIIKQAFRLAGLEVRRVSSQAPPKVYESPMEALYERSGQEAAFCCSLSDCVAFNGLRYGTKGWHPYAGAASEISRHHAIAYADSTLKSFYDDWQPNNAREALLAEGVHPSGYQSLPSHYVATPWSSTSPSECGQATERWILEKQGHLGLSIDDGTFHQGPVSLKRGSLELQRVKEVYMSIRENGYQREAGWDGDISVHVLRRDNEWTYLVNHGHHRAGALSGLGYETVPVRFNGPPMIIDAEDAAYWPQVRRGVWTREDALKYFNHLFDFDSRAWATERGLLPEPRSLNPQPSEADA